ncbi:hypothetical protein Tco_0446494 [Tanacetum coccineum]
MHEVIEEEWDRKEVDGFKWKHQWEAKMSSSYDGADNEVLTDAVTWRYFLVRVFNKKDKNKGKADKTDHGIGKSVENQSRRHIHS